MRIDPFKTPRWSEKKPNYIQLLIRKNHLGRDVLADKIITEPQSYEGKLWVLCRDIYESLIKRGYIEAALLTGEPDDVIAELFEMSLEVLQLYKKTCFNIDGWSRLDKIAYLDKELDKDVLVMKLWAIQGGLDFIKWRLGHKVQIDPLKGLIELFAMCFNKSREALFNPNISQASIEATKWTKLSMDIARLLKMWTTDNDQAREDLEDAIKNVVPNFKSLDDLIAESEADKKKAAEPSEEAEKIIEDIVNDNSDNPGDGTESIG